MDTQILVVKFDKVLQPHHLPLFRGAMIDKMKYADNSILSHNHDGDKFRYSYPLIQYKLLNNYASIVAINEGIGLIKSIFEIENLMVNIGSKRSLLNVQDVKFGNFQISCHNQFQSYKLLSWLPLNEENYITYQKIDTLIERCAFLERILVGNILSMLKGLGITAEEKIVCMIQDIFDVRVEETNHNVMQLAFDVQFKTNILLPQFIGLGNQTSLGFGTIYNVNPKAK